LKKAVQKSGSKQAYRSQELGGCLAGSMDPMKSSQQAKQRWSNKPSLLPLVVERSLLYQEKHIYLQLEDKKLLVLRIDLSDESNLTCGWLLSEAIRQMQRHYEANSVVFDVSRVKALTTCNQNYTLDFYLFSFEKNLSAIKDGEILLPFFAGMSLQLGLTIRRAV